MELSALYDEVKSYIDDINVWDDGERIFSNYQKVTGYILRLTEIRNELAMGEITGTITPELKKFRTLVLDPTLEQLKDVARYESRKLTARQMEFEMEGKR